MTQTSKLLRKSGSFVSTSSLARCFGSQTQSFTLPDLSYSYEALEPVLPARIMELHHSKHHQTYVNNLNISLEKRHKAECSGDIATMVQLDNSIKFNGGGHVNHSIFWQNLCPINLGGGEISSGKLLNDINNKWGSLDNFKESFNSTTAAIQGSGWGWLVFDPKDKQLKIQTMSNQDPVASLGLIPLLGIDVWEHAYYLKYENRRPDYLKEIWKIINWKDIQQRYNECN